MLEYRFRGRLALALKPFVQAFDRIGYLLWNRNREFTDAGRLHSIAIIQPSGLGDVLLTLPLAHYLKHRRGMKVTLIVSSAAAAWLRQCPWLDQVVALDLPFLAPHGQSSNAKTIEALRAIDADIIYEVRGDLRLSALLFRSGRPAGGFGCGGGGFLLDRVLEFKTSHHSLNMYNAILRDLGITEDPLLDWSPDLVPAAPPPLPPSPLPKDFIALHVGTGWQSKQWPVENFIALAGRLAASHPVVVLGGPRDLSEAQHAALARIANCTDLAGKLDFAETLGATACARLYVGQDTGATHGAALLGKPVVALYSGIDDYRFLPPVLYSAQVRVIQNRPHCSGPNGCARRICLENICMTDITVAQVLRAIEDKLALPTHVGPWQPGIAQGTPWKGAA
jgi:heptosyltransferase II